MSNPKLGDLFEIKFPVTDPQIPDLNFQIGESGISLEDHIFWNLFGANFRSTGPFSNITQSELAEMLYKGFKVNLTSREKQQYNSDSKSWQIRFIAMVMARHHEQTVMQKLAIVSNPEEKEDTGTLLMGGNRIRLNVAGFVINMVTQGHGTTVNGVKETPRTVIWHLEGHLRIQAFTEETPFEDTTLEEVANLFNRSTEVTLTPKERNLFEGIRTSDNIEESIIHFIAVILARHYEEEKESRD